jgi:S1-C subfamily serine protease
MATDKIIDFMGAQVKNLNSLDERSATGMDSTRGVFVVKVTTGSAAAGFLQANDVILSFDNREINNLDDLSAARMSVIGTNTEVVLFRNQKKLKERVELKMK